MSLAAVLAVLRIRRSAPETERFEPDDESLWFRSDYRGSLRRIQSLGRGSKTARLEVLIRTLGLLRDYCAITIPTPRVRRAQGRVRSPYTRHCRTYQVQSAVGWVRVSTNKLWAGLAIPDWEASL